MSEKKTMEDCWEELIRASQWIHWNQKKTETKKKLAEVSEAKLARPIEDALFLKKEIIDELKRSEKTTNRWKSFDKTSDSDGAQLHGMNSFIVKMKDEGDDRYKHISETFTNIEKKILDMDKGNAVITGFHSETSEPEVIQFLTESTTETGMTMENARIECTAKPITHAFIHFKNDEERKQIRQVSEHAEKRVTRKKVEDIAINGRR